MSELCVPVSVIAGHQQGKAYSNRGKVDPARDDNNKRNDEKRERKEVKMGKPKRVKAPGNPVRTTTREQTHHDGTHEMKTLHARVTAASAGFSSSSSVSTSLKYADDRVLDGTVTALLGAHAVVSTEDTEVRWNR